MSTPSRREFVKTAAAAAGAVLLPKNLGGQPSQDAIVSPASHLEEHGWERPENRRDAFQRTVDFLRTHVLDEPAR